MPHYVQKTATSESSSRQPGEPVAFRSRSVPVAYVVFAVGVIEIIACRVAWECTGVVGELAFGMMLSVAVSQVELVGCWLAVGRRRLISRMALCMALPLAWNCIFESLHLEWEMLAFLLVLPSIVVVGGVAGRLLGAELREVQSHTIPLCSTGANSGRWQFSISDLLLLMLMVAVVFAPFRPGLHFDSVLGRATWLHVGCAAIVVALSWIIVRAALAIGRRPRREPLSGEVTSEGLSAAGRRADSWDSQVEYFVLIVLALAWLLGPLRGVYYGHDPLEQALNWDCNAWIWWWTSGSWTLAITWAMLAEERPWWRWGPCAVVYALGIIYLAVSVRWVYEDRVLSLVFFLQTLWSLPTLFLVRRAGYRLCRVRRKQAPQE
jgi:hypothetical protein